MKTAAKIKALAKEKHDRLTENYYAERDKGGMTKEEFDERHGQIWNDMEEELMVLGYIKKGRNWKQEYQAADTLTERQDIIAERLSLK